MSFIKYLLVGVLNTCVGLGVIYFCMYVMALNVVNANGVGYAVGIIFSFILNKSWTFKSDVKPFLGFVRFLMVLMVAYLANIYCVLYLIDHIGVNPYWAQALGIFPYTIIGFLGSHFFVFGSKSNHISYGNAIYPDAVIPSLDRPVKIAIVMPCYNEEAVLKHTINELSVLLEKMIQNQEISDQSFIYCVDDGSQDLTWDIIENLSITNAKVHGIKLSHNCGHQNALLAGLLNADAEAVISVDADMQDDLDAIPKMVQQFKCGNEVVYGIRDDRKQDSFFKRKTAEWYYRLLQMMGVEIVFNHADYRLLSKKVIIALKGYSEVNLFLRGIIPKLGYKHSYVFYKRAERFAGESKYTLIKMLALAWDGVTSFSSIPLRLITVLGLIISFFSFVILLWVFYISLFTDRAVPGWASTVLPIYFLGGVQLLSLGIIAEYVGKVFLETKRRPRYLIDKIV